MVDGQRRHRDDIIDDSPAVLLLLVLATVSVSDVNGETKAGKLNVAGDSLLLLRRLLVERVPLEGNCPAI